MGAHSVPLMSSTRYDRKQQTLLMLVFAFFACGSSDAAEIAGVKIVKKATQKTPVMDMRLAKASLKRMEEGVQDALVSTISGPGFTTALLAKTIRIPTSSQAGNKAAEDYLKVARILHRIGVMGTHAELEAFRVVKALRAQNFKGDKEAQRQKFEKLIRSRFSTYYYIAKACRHMTKLLSIKASVVKRQTSMLNSSSKNSQLLLSRLGDRAATTHEKFVTHGADFVKFMKVVLARHAKRVKSPKVQNNDAASTKQHGHQGKVQSKLPIPLPTPTRLVAEALVNQQRPSLNQQRQR